MNDQPNAVLVEYGFTPALARSLPDETLPARVLRHDGSSLLAMTAAGPRPVRPLPLLDPAPTVGDWLALRPSPDGGVQDARIEAVLPRRSLLRRRSVQGGGPQALAANVDVVLIVCGVDRPLTAGRIQRAATQGWDAGAEPVLVLTKVRGPHAQDLDLDRIALEVPAVPVLATSALEGVGMDTLRQRISGSTAVLIGESGAGKSTLCNVLLGRPAAATGAVRGRDHKGRHTTSARALHLLPGGDGALVIDTPGLRSLGLFAEPDSVDSGFTDLQELARQCRFTDCAHEAEPGCAVLAACADGRLAQARYDSWRRLQREAASADLRADPHLLRRHYKRMAQVHKEAAQHKRS